MSRSYYYSKLGANYHSKTTAPMSNHKFLLPNFFESNNVQHADIQKHENISLSKQDNDKTQQSECKSCLN
jgi:hypothetical protein